MVALLKRFANFFYKKMFQIFFSEATNRRSSTVEKIFQVFPNSREAASLQEKKNLAVGSGRGVRKIFQIFPTGEPPTNLI